MVQMLADLVLIGVVARVLLGTVHQRRAALGQEPADGRGERPVDPS
jgi:hypothetical protein